MRINVETTLRVLHAAYTSRSVIAMGKYIEYTEWNLFIQRSGLW